MKNYLNFENEVKELEAELEALKDPYNKEGISEVNTNEIKSFEDTINNKLEKIYSNLNPWQTTQVARHEDRPKAKYFIENLFSDFISLSGDRFYGEDNSVIAGFGKFNDNSVLVIGQEKGENLEERLDRNFGMMRPEGYRKSIRLMELANKFNIPIISFIDTPGAYPGITAEQRGQAQAIGQNIMEMSRLTVPVLCFVIGEGGSGGALAIGVGNKTYMMSYSIYSVISPEGCASILLKDASKAAKMAKVLKITAQDALKLNVIDGIVKEPEGGAHRNIDDTAVSIAKVIERDLKELRNMSKLELCEQRFEKFAKLGSFD